MPLALGQRPPLLHSARCPSHWTLPLLLFVVDAITGTSDGGYRDLGIHDTRHLIFFEPWAIRNLVDQSLELNVPFTKYPNLVYAPHEYTHVFTVDSTIGPRLPAPVPIPYPPSYDQALTTAHQLSPPWVVITRKCPLPFRTGFFFALASRVPASARIAT